MRRRDAIVIGGGPAGSAAAAALARGGRDVLLLERDVFPRFHIGESLLPGSRVVFRALGVDGAIDRAGFVEKRGAFFLDAEGEASHRVAFESRAHQVPRARFDEVLLRHAAACGAEVKEACRVRDAEVRADGVRVVHDHGEDEARVLVDASGRHGFLAQRFSLRQPDPALRKVACYRHFSGVPRAPGAEPGDIVIVSLRNLGWIWFIPLPDGVTSVGAVLDRSAHRAGEDPADALARAAAGAPAAAALLARAEPAGPARYEGDFSYAVARYAGPGWLLAGDAGSFLDPVFSTGVHLALHGGLEAAQAILAGTPRAFARYERLQRRRYRFFRRFVTGFYEPAFRDLLFRPALSPLTRALVSVLAGCDRPGPARRAWISLFFLFARMQRHLPIVPRLHAHGAAHAC